MGPPFTGDLVKGGYIIYENEYILNDNALKEELDHSVVANFATTASDGKTYQVEHYNLDMIISVGYSVKPNRGVEFRKRWFYSK